MTNWKMNLNAPDFMILCIDSMDSGELSGLIYHRIDAAPVPFADSGRLLLRIDELCDRLNYPQASTESRRFDDAAPARETVSATLDPEVLLSRRGSKATFALWIQYRQNATWQGRLAWIERDLAQPFYSALELLKLLDSAVHEP